MWRNFIMDDHQFSYITNMRKKNPGSICTAVVKLPVMLNCRFHPAASGPVAYSLRTWSHVVWWYDSMLAISSLIPNDVYWSKPWAPTPSPAPSSPRGRQHPDTYQRGTEDRIRQEDIVTHNHHASHWWIQKSTKWLSDTKPAYILTAKEEQRKQLIMNLGWVSARWKLITLPSPKCWTVIKIWNRYPPTRILFYFNVFFHLTDP
jgi:hypothetical protein